MITFVEVFDICIGMTVTHICFYNVTINLHFLSMRPGIIAVVWSRIVTLIECRPEASGILVLIGTCLCLKIASVAF